MSQSDEKAQQVNQPQSVKELASVYQTQKVEYVPILDTGDSYVLEISKKLIQRSGTVQMPPGSGSNASEHSDFSDPADIAAEKELHALFEQFDALGSQIDGRQAEIKRMEERARVEMAELKQMIAKL